MIEKAPLDPKPKSLEASITDGNTTLTNEQLAELANLEKQAEYRREYLTQLQRRACPGCGENVSSY